MALSYEEFHKNFFGDIDFSGFGVEVPPQSFRSSGAEVISFVKRKSLINRFIVKKEQTNPMGNLQGGILASFFDDTFGPLSYSAARGPVVTIDLDLTFSRGVTAGEEVIIKAELTSIGPQMLTMTANAYNKKEKLIANATSSCLILKGR